jgi:hypothetical protein
MLRFSGDVYVSAGPYDDVLLWHCAFARHWFKINLTTDLAGRIVETGADEPGSRFAFNCDIATHAPLWWGDRNRTSSPYASSLQAVSKAVPVRGR